MVVFTVSNLIHQHKDSGLCNRIFLPLFPLHTPLICSGGSPNLAEQIWGVCGLCIKEISSFKCKSLCWQNMLKFVTNITTQPVAPHSSVAKPSDILPKMDPTLSSSSQNTLLINSHFLSSQNQMPAPWQHPSPQTKGHLRWSINTFCHVYRLALR